MRSGATLWRSAAFLWGSALALLAFGARLPEALGALLLVWGTAFAARHLRSMVRTFLAVDVAAACGAGLVAAGAFPLAAVVPVLNAWRVPECFVPEDTAGAASRSFLLNAAMLLAAAIGPGSEVTQTMVLLGAVLAVCVLVWPAAEGAVLRSRAGVAVQAGLVTALALGLGLVVAFLIPVFVPAILPVHYVPALPSGKGSLTPRRSTVASGCFIHGKPAPPSACSWTPQALHSHFVPALWALLGVLILLELWWLWSHRSTGAEVATEQEVHIETRPFRAEPTGPVAVRPAWPYSSADTSVRRSFASALARLPSRRRHATARELREAFDSAEIATYEVDRYARDVPLHAAAVQRGRRRISEGSVAGQRLPVSLHRHGGGRRVGAALIAAPAAMLLLVVLFWHPGREASPKFLTNAGWAVVEAAPHRFAPFAVRLVAVVGAYKSSESVLRSQSVLFFVPAGPQWFPVVGIVPPGVRLRPGAVVSLRGEVLGTIRQGPPGEVRGLPQINVETLTATTRPARFRTVHEVAVMQDGARVSLYSVFRMPGGIGVVLGAAVPSARGGSGYDLQVVALRQSHRDIPPQVIPGSPYPQNTAYMDGGTSAADTFYFPTASTTDGTVVVEVGSTDGSQFEIKFPLYP